jgi:serine/threonine protein phosphatase 1
MRNPYKAVQDPVGRTIVVGDIHGCWAELQELLGIVAFGHEDTLVAVGDLLDRGPATWSVARFFRNTPNVYSVIGNHERRVAGVIRGTSHPAWSQKQSLSLLPKEEQEGWAGWLETLPAVIETPHAIIAHARLDPGKPLTQQDSHFTAAVGGPSVKIALDSEGVPLWFGQMRFKKPVCVGHVGYDRVVLLPNSLYALDTRAVHGGQLSAVVFPGGTVVQVPAARNHHQETYRAWRMSHLPSSTDPMGWSLAQAVKVLSAREDDRAQYATEIASLMTVIQGLDLAAYGHQLQSILLQHFGQVPAPGLERGEFFKRIKKEFPEWSLRTLAVRLFRSKPLDFVDLAAAFPRTKVAQAANMLGSIEVAFSKNIVLTPVSPDG